MLQESVDTLQTRFGIFPFLLDRNRLSVLGTQERVGTSVGPTRQQREVEANKVERLSQELLDLHPTSSPPPPPPKNPTQDKTKAFSSVSYGVSVATALGKIKNLP